MYIVKHTNYWGRAWQPIPPSFCCGVRYVVSRCRDVAIWSSLVVVVVSRTCGCRVGDDVMWCDASTHTPTRINPDPWERVWVSCGLGAGGPKITQGLPVTCTSSSSISTSKLPVRGLQLMVDLTTKDYITISSMSLRMCLGLLRRNVPKIYSIGGRSQYFLSLNEYSIKQW